MKRVFDIVQERVTIAPGEPMFGFKANNVWHTINTKEVWQQAQDLAAALLTLNLKNDILVPEQQEKIALISPNRPEWLITDLAVQQTGAILTPLYPTLTPSEFEYILNQAEVRIIFFSDKNLVKKFEHTFSNIPTLKHIYTFDKTEGTHHWKELQPTLQSKALLTNINTKILPDTTATIIYTSGTTGKPKGVMLSHKNITSNLTACKPIFHFAQKGDKSLSFLPLNHIFEKTVSYVYIQAGVCIYYAEGMETIGDNLKEVKPIVFTCVPRLLEKVYDKIIGKGIALKSIKKSLFFWAVNLGKKYDNSNKGSFFYRLQLALANKIIFNKWREALGGNVKAIVSGAAALQTKYIRIFSAANITIMEGYGLTETSPVISVNTLESESRRIGTVGKALEGINVKIAEDGEIITQSDSVMVGYYKEPEQTNEVIKDGWFHTGDIGELVEDKYIKITDRKKEIFKNSGGKYIAPQNVEGILRQSIYIEQAMAVGSGEKYVAALIVPSFTQLKSKLKSDGIAIPESNEALLALPEVNAIFKKEISKYNGFLSAIEQVKKFTLLPKEWNIEEGLLTPKLSLKRKPITEKFKEEITKMF